MGFNWSYEGPSEIFDEMASLTPFFSQCSYDVLEGWNSFCWGSQDGTDTPVLFLDGFNFPDKKARFGLFDYVPPVVFPKSSTCPLIMVVCLSTSTKGT